MIIDTFCPCDVTTEVTVKTKNEKVVLDLSVLKNKMTKICFTYKELEAWRKEQQGLAT